MQWFLFFPHIDEVEQIHTKALLASLYSFIKPLLENPHPLNPHYFINRLLLKNISSVISVVIFIHNCVFHFSILVSVGSQKCSLVWYTSKHGVAHNPTLHSLHLYFVLVSLFLVQHTWHWILLHCMSQYLLCHESSLFSWCMDGACLRLVAWGQGTLPSSYIRSFTSVSLNCQCDNFDPQEARMIKFLWMERSRRWNSSFFVPVQVHLLID